MAIFYEHIKGCGPDNTYTSWIKWSNESNEPSNFDCKYLPKILIGTDTTNGKKDFGTIITSNAINQYITTPFRFWQDITVLGGIHLEYNQNGDKCTILVDGQGSLAINNTNTITFNTQSFTTTAIKAQSGNIATITATTIKATDRCEADHFNATSDARAKTNITPTQFSALAVVNAIPTYTFSYIHKPQERVLGLIAQDAAEYNLDGFNMVDNLTASGEDGDFMQMKESKLVYVLWKAVQELTDEVESLKAQLNNLK